MPSQPMFRASEMLQMAIEIERSGLAFYEACVHATAVHLRRMMNNTARPDKQLWTSLLPR